MKKYIIPDNQFPVKIEKEIFMLGNYFFNIFLVKGKEKSALFEVGISAGVDTVITQLDRLGIQPDFLISSHPHSDHITGLPGLAARFPNAQIIVGVGARDFIEHPKAGPMMFKEDAFMARRLSDFNILPGRPPLENIPDLKDAFVVDNKKILDLGGIHLELIKMDGHSPGNLMGIVHQKKILFCSDSLGFHYPGRGYHPLFFTQAASYVSTLKFIKGFSPAIICPAHQGPLMGQNAAEGIQHSLDITMDTIKMIQHSPLPDDALAEVIFKQSYRDEFTIYTEANIKNCTALLIKRAKEAQRL